MGGGEGGNLVSRGEVPGRTFKRVPPDGLCRTEDVTP